MHTKITLTLFFLLFLGILRCGDLLLLQQRGKQALHIIPLLVYIKPALYSFLRASFHLSSLLQFCSQGFMTSRIVFSTTASWIFSIICMVQLQILPRHAAKFWFPWMAPWAAIMKAILDSHKNRSHAPIPFKTPKSSRGQSQYPADLYWFTAFSSSLVPVFYHLVNILKISLKLSLKMDSKISNLSWIFR